MLNVSNNVYVEIRERGTRYWTEWSDSLCLRDDSECSDSSAVSVSAAYNMSDSSQIL